MAGGLIEVARATVTIIPNMQGSQREITEQITGTTNPAVDKAGQSSGKTLGSAMQKGFGSVGTALTKGVTAPVLAASVASVASWKDVDAAMDTVTIKTGASGTALTDMQNRAKAIATTMPTSFQTAGDAIGEVNTRFGLTGDALQDLSTQFIKFSEINGTDVSTSIDSTQKALAAFGLSSDQAGAMLDSLNAAGQKSGIGMDTLTQDLTANASAFKSMGMGAADSINALAGIEKSGIDVGTAMTAMSRLQKQAASDGTTMSAELTKAVSSPKEAMKAFGRSGVKMYEAFKSGTLTVDEFSGSSAKLSDNLGSVSSTFSKTESPMDRLQVVMNSLKEAGYGLVEAMGPTISSVLNSLTSVIQGLTKAWQGLSPGMQQAIIKIALIGAAIGPALVAMSKVMGAISTLRAGFAVLTGPIGLVVAAIAAAVAIGVVLYKNWDKIKAAAKALGAHIKSTFAAIRSAIVAPFRLAWSGVSKIFSTMRSGISAAMSAIKNVIGRVFGTIFRVITAPFRKAWAFISGIAAKIRGVFNFHWSLPHLSLPHISVKGGKAPFGIGGKGNLPKFSIKWYRKAEDNPYFLDGATIFGAMGGELLGGGEHAREMIYGHQALMQDIRDAVSGGMQTNVTMNVYGAQGQDVSDLADIVASKIVSLGRRKAAMIG